MYNIYHVLHLQTKIKDFLSLKLKISKLNYKNINLDGHSFSLKIFDFKPLL